MFSQISFIAAITEKQEILPDQINFIVLHRMVHKTKRGKISQLTERIKLMHFRDDIGNRTERTL